MGEPSSFQIIQPEGMYRAPNYVHAIRAGNTLYVAGQVAFDDEGKIVAPGDAAAQAEVVFSKLDQILRAAGAEWSNVVKMTTFLVDRADSQAVTAVRLRYLGEHRPPHTGVIVAGLGSPDFRLEAELIAVIPD